MNKSKGIGSRIKICLLIVILLLTQVSPMVFATDNGMPNLVTYRMYENGTQIKLHFSEGVYINPDEPLYSIEDCFRLHFNNQTQDLNVSIESITNLDGTPFTEGNSAMIINLDIENFSEAGFSAIYLLPHPYCLVDADGNRLQDISWLIIYSYDSPLRAGTMQEIDVPNSEEPTPEPPSLINEENDVEIFVSPDGNNDNYGTLEAPIQSFEKALEMVRTYITEDINNIKVIFRGGRYEIDETIVLDESISLNNGHQVIFTNYPNEVPVFSGGKFIDQAPTVEDGLFVIELPEVEPFRQLYTNGTHEKAIVAREPNEDFISIHQWVLSPPSIVVPSAYINFDTNDLDEMEMVVFRAYNQNRIRIESMNTTSGITTITPKATEGELIVQTKPRKSDKSFYFENAKQFIDIENEYYYDRAENKVYYKPSPSDSVEDFRIIVPQLETIFEFDNASNIVFSGLTVEHSNWNLPNDQGFFQRQGGMYYSLEDTYDDRGKRLTQIEPAAIELTDSDDLTFHRNVIKYTGANGVNFNEGTHDNVFVGNVFTEIGDTAMYVGVEQQPYPAPGKANEDEYIYSNLFHRMGVEYSGSAAIFSTYPTHLVIENNEIGYSDNLGINMGWLNYETDDTALQSGLISKNYFHHTGMRHGDSGAIHTKNNHPNLLIEKNYFEDIRKDTTMQNGFSITNSIYLDNYTSNSVVTRNEFENVNKPIHLNTNSYYNSLSNNDINDQSIINEAGLVSDYSDISNALNGACIGTGAPYGLDVSIPGTHNTSAYFLSGTGTIFEYNVDDQEVDTIPQGIDSYLANETLGHVLVKQEDTGNKYIEIVDLFNKTKMKQFIGIPLNNLNANTITLSMRIRSNTPQTAIYAHFMDGNRTVAKSGLSPVNNSVRIWNGENREFYSNYPSNTWLNYSIELNLGNNTYRYTLDGFQSPWVSLNGSTDGIDAIYLAPEWKQGTFWIDDITLTAE